jgi:hypothetical protein
MGGSLKAEGFGDGQYTTSHQQARAQESSSGKVYFFP